MKIQIKRLENGSILVDKNALNEFKQHVMNDTYVKGQMTSDRLDTINRFGFYGIVNDGKNHYTVCRIIITRDYKGVFHAYDFNYAPRAGERWLTEVYFNGEDTLFTEPQDAMDYCEKLNAEHAAPSTECPLAFGNETTQEPAENNKSVFESNGNYGDFVIAVLDAIQKVMQEQKKDVKPATPQTETTEEKPAKVEATKVVDTLNTNKLKNMSLAEKVRLGHIQERVDFCQQNISKLQGKIKNNQKMVESLEESAKKLMTETKANAAELKQWTDECNRYIDELNIITGKTTK